LYIFTFISAIYLIFTIIALFNYHLQYLTMIKPNCNAFLILKSIYFVLFTARILYF